MQRSVHLSVFLKEIWIVVDVLSHKSSHHRNVGFIVVEDSESNRIGIDTLDIPL
jgi:hypothetical protein